MGCFGSRVERGEVRDQQKWDYITLSDFKSKSCGTLFSYIWLWILVFVTIAVYAADTFTAVKLIGFNQWSSEIKPTIPFDVAKWIFSACIILSWTLAIYAWISAIRTIRRGCVTEDYMNSMAVTLQSIRTGSGWKRFLVFAELTKSKKKVSWIALFVYFQRQGAIRLLAADGPRQAVNALTLYSVAQAKLLTQDPSAHRSGLDQFFYNLKILGQQQETQTIILSTMAFTLIIWVVSMLLLILAMILYFVFLWHYIQNETLSGFCRRKVETRLARIVKAKSDKVLAKQQKKWEKEERKLYTGSTSTLGSTLPPAFNRQPTLPTIAGSPDKGTLARADSVATLPAYTSQPTTPVGPTPSGLARQPTLPNVMSGRPPPPSRSATGFSDASYGSNASLLGEAAGMGYSNSPRGPPLMARSMTGSSQGSFSSNPMQGRPPLPPLATQGGPRYPPPLRTNTGFSTQSRGSPMSSSTNNYTPLSAQSNRPLLNSPMSPWDARNQSPAPAQSYEMTNVDSSRNYEGGDYFSSQGLGPLSTIPASRGGDVPPSLQMPRRNMTGPMPLRQAAPSGTLPWPPTQRSATAPVPDYVRGPMQRSATAGPQNW